MHFEFARFSTQSFERFVQSLATAVVGARVQVYGAGKDGAREATYRGQCKIGHVVWDGYVVFQAKYHGVIEQPARNAAWLVRELDNEMAKFSNKKRGLVTPDYYVLATNVRLSANAADAAGKGSGGIDRVTKRLDYWKAKLGMRDVLLWHADTLGALLEQHEGVRTSYGFWVLPSDVLAAMLRTMGPSANPDLPAKYLRNSLRQSREIKARDVGQAFGQKIYIEQVFNDLPIAPRTLDAPVIGISALSTTPETEDDLEDEYIDDDAERSENPTLQIVGELMRFASNKFDPLSITKPPKGRPRHRNITIEHTNRVLLLGGPGQGKSTIGQFIAQLCRARLLSEMRESQSPEINDAIDKILRCAEEEQIPITGPLRYPFHVELPRYADLLSAAEKSGKHFSILSHLADDVKVRGEVDAASPSTLTKWVKALPTIIILDGLDEVPPSGNRTSVVNAIEELIDTLHETNADSLVFATSRPQGFRNDLSPEYWAHWHLEPLGRAHALAIAARASIVLVEDIGRRDEIIASLTQASIDEATAPLLVSPLQVMLLFQLVATHNNIPKDRWTLFQRHYETLRDREITKGGWSGTTIRNFRTQIDRIHSDAGYLLHLRAEDAGGANAFFRGGEFRQLVRDRLKEDGFDEIEKHTDEIDYLATNRLVFLRSQTEGHVAFDIRSLQEFMAAARITTSPEESIMPRLRETAGRAHWLHVFKIACSKIFSTDTHEALRDGVIALLDSLDVGDRSFDDRVARTGARLAMQLLLDGVASGLPLYRRKLMARALSLLEVQGTRELPELAKALDTSQSVHLEPLVSEIVRRPEDDLNRRVLILLGLLNQNGRASNSWVIEALLQAWPSDPLRLFEVYSDISYLPDRQPFVEMFRNAQWAATPTAVIDWCEMLEGPEIDYEEIRNFQVCVPPRRRSCALVRKDGVATDFWYLYQSIHDGLSVDDVPPQAANIWTVAKAVDAFSRSPSIEKAAAFLDCVMTGEHAEVETMLPLPWVLASVMHGCRNSAELRLSRQKLVDGRYGNEDVWSKAEKRWAAVGVTIEDLDVREMHTSFDVRGAPLPLRGHFRRAYSRDDATAVLIDRVDMGIADDSLRDLLVYVRGKGSYSPSLVNLLVNVGAGDALPDDIVHIYAGTVLAVMTKALGEDWNRLSQCLLKVLPACRDRSPRASVEVAEQALVPLFSLRPDERKLLGWLGQVGWHIKFRAALGKLPASAFSIESFDSQNVAAGVAALRIYSGNVEPGDKDTVRALVQGELDQASRVIGRLSHESDSGASAWTKAIAREMLVSKRSNEFIAYIALRNAIEGETTTLSENSTAASLKLPPSLGHQAVAPSVM